MKAALEMISLIGPINNALEKINFFKALLCEPQLKYLRQAIFNCLVSLGYEGFTALVEIASKDYSNLQSFVLDSLLHLRPVQRIILVPSILA